MGIAEISPSENLCWKMALLENDFHFSRIVFLYVFIYFLDSQPWPQQLIISPSFDTNHSRPTAKHFRAKINIEVEACKLNHSKHGYRASNHKLASMKFMGNSFPLSSWYLRPKVQRFCSINTLCASLKIHSQVRRRNHPSHENRQHENLSDKEKNRNMRNFTVGC